MRATSAADSTSSYDTQAFTLTVNANDNSGTSPDSPTGLAVDPSSNTGPFDGNGYISKDTPKLTVTAETGATVKFNVNGVVIATGTETATGSGIYTATLPSGKLGIGANAITATVTDTGGTSVDSAAMSVIYAPDLGNGVYVVPGAQGSTQSVVMTWKVKNAAYNDEMGYFIVNSIDGSIGGIGPGQAGYAQAALSSSYAQSHFCQGAKAGASETIPACKGASWWCST